MLQVLDLSENKIGKLSPHCWNLRQLPNLLNLNLSNNKINDAQAVVPFFGHFKEMTCLNLSENPVVELITPYKKTMVKAIPKLAMIDERTVSDMERLRANQEEGSGI